MSKAREDFLQRMGGFFEALSSDALVDGAVHEQRRNAAARIIRNGLVVIAFSTFEDFIRSRGREVLDFLTGCRIPFNSFSDDFKKIVTIGAVEAVKNRIAFIDDLESCITFVQEESKKIGSTAGANFQFSEISFGFSRTNIQAEEIEKFLKALNFAKPWESIGFFADRLGVGSLKRIGARNYFVSLARQRNEAAHNPNTNVQPTDLESLYLNLMGLAGAFDAIVSHVCISMREQGHRFDCSRAEFKASDIKICLVDLDINDSFCWKFENDRRYRRRRLQRNEVMLQATNSCRDRKAFLVMRDARRVPCYWDMPRL